VNFKEFAYRSSLSVISKSALNFGNMIYSLSISSDKENSSDLDIEDLMMGPAPKEKKQTQMEKIRKKNIIRVAIVENKAYFVHENTFYTASLVDGEVDRSSASPINAFDMNKKEMKLLLSILDNMN
jgi:hypothetical protein